MVPPPTAVTSPVDETVATDALDEAHGVVASGVPEPVNCMLEPPTVIFCAPEIVGISDTFTVIAVRGLSQGFTFKDDAKVNPTSVPVCTAPFT